MSDHQVFELRQYTLRPGQRERLVELFERHFIEPQEALGMGLPGQFRDLDDPDRFVWLRSCADMPARAGALAAFYDGPVWRAHRDAANATMLDSDDVLLLKPVQPFAMEGLVRPGSGVRAATGVLTATLCPLAPEQAKAWARDFHAQLQPLLERHGAHVLASFITEPARNTYPRLPVREDDFVFVWFTAFADASALAAHESACRNDPAVAAWLDQHQAQTHTLRLAPTPRSLLRGAPVPRSIMEDA